MQRCAGGRLNGILKSIGVSLGMACATLLALEILLRVCDFRELREGVDERSLGYKYDAEIGWLPRPNSTSMVTNARTIHVRHNSLGLRDDEFSLDDKPTIMFLGDSFVWGLDSEAGERFSDLLKSKIRDYKILAAGVSGYGTDQEYLLLRRLWPQVKPAIVVLVFCTENDRQDNSTNARYEGYHKPYFTIGADGQLELHGQPVPLSRLQYFREVPLVRNLWLARLAVSIYLKISQPVLFVPDVTEQIIGKIRTFSEANGARFLVVLNSQDGRLIDYLERSGIAFTSLDGAAIYPSKKLGGHWTPEGQAFVAEHILGLLTRNKIVARPDKD
jgi:hypothetical protein